MRGLPLLGPILFVAGVAALAFGVARGEATLNLVVIFPVVTATGLWPALGIVLIVAAFIVSFFTWPAQLETLPPPPSTWSPQSPAIPPPQRRWGGVVFLGPIPIVFGSDARVTKWMLVLGVVLFLALLALAFYVLWSI